METGVHKMQAMGIDIGTTTLSFVIIDCETRQLIHSLTIDNDTFLRSDKPWEKVQDPNRIWAKVSEHTERLLRMGTPVDYIGLTGQMHGILYLDKAGNPLSPLYTWQDGSGDEKISADQSATCAKRLLAAAPVSSSSKENQPATSAKRLSTAALVPSQSRENQSTTYVKRLSERTGYPMATGFGATRYYVHSKKGEVPKGAACICTIMDYIGMKLTGRTEPLLDATNAASLGLFDVQKGRFDEKAIRRAGMEPELYPKIAREESVLGTFRYDNKRIPVGIAIGDNQASFLGAVTDIEHSILVNVGTGSQISLWTDAFYEVSGMETRPFAKGGYLLVGSSLCGGRAYAMLAGFYKSVICRFARFREDQISVSDQDIYLWMDRLLDTCERDSQKGQLSDACERDSQKNQLPDACERDSQMDRLLDACKRDSQTEMLPLIRPTFCGTRTEPDLTGAMEGLTERNFTPEAVTYAMIAGMVRELKDWYDRCPGPIKRDKRVLVGSGNGIRKNEHMKRQFASAFDDMPLVLSAAKEEAACGAALGYVKFYSVAER